MKKILNIFVFLVPILQVVLFQCALFFSAYFVYFIVGAFFMTDIFLYLLIPKKTEKRKIFIISFPPLALLLATSAMLFFLEGHQAQLLVVALHAILQILYAIRMHRFLFKEGYPEIFFNETVSVVLLVSYFFFSFSFYALVYFLEIPIWYIIAPFLLLTFLFFMVHLWIRGHTIRKHVLVLIVFTVLIMEAMLVIRWLPSLYHVNAFFITVLYFVIISVGCESLQKEISLAQKILTVILSLGMVVLLMTTAQWR